MPTAELAQAYEDAVESWESSADAGQWDITSGDEVAH